MDYFPVIINNVFRNCIKIVKFVPSSYLHLL